MLKRSKKILLIVLGVLLISGCKAKSETSMIINNDKSVDIEGVIGFDDELIDAMISMDNSSSLDDLDTTEEYTDLERREYLKESFAEEDMKDIKESGFVIQEYEDDTYMGYVMSKKLITIDDYVGNNTEVNISDLQNSTDKKIFTKEGSIYKGSFKIDNLEEQEGMDSYNIDFDYKFIVVLPNKVLKSNATLVSEDGKTLTWDLTNTNIDAIEFEFEFPSFLAMIKDNMFIIAGIAVSIILIIVIIITVIIAKSKKRRKNKKENNEKVNIQDSTTNVQQEVQPLMPQDSVMNVQPEVQPIMPQDPVMNMQPEVQPVMPQDPVMNMQPEPQKPIVIQDIEEQPEVAEQPINFEPLMEQSSNSQPLFPQDIVPPKDYN